MTTLISFPKTNNEVLDSVKVTESVEAIKKYTNHGAVWMCQDLEVAGYEIPTEVLVAGTEKIYVKHIFQDMLAA